MKWDGDIKLIDDYGHHPTEIKATLSAVKSMWEGRIMVVFQPHRFTRTKALMDEFVTSFNEADFLIVTEIYAASEEKIEGVSGSCPRESGSRRAGHRNVRFSPPRRRMRRR